MSSKAIMASHGYTHTRGGAKKKRTTLYDRKRVIFGVLLLLKKKIRLREKRTRKKNMAREIYYLKTLLSPYPLAI